MYNALIAGITALSLTLASAQPVRAGGLSQDDIGKILFGLVATATLSAAINNNRNDLREPATRNTYTNEQTQRVPRSEPRRSNNTRNDVFRSEVLPRHCVTHVSTRFGEHRVVDRRCLRRNDVRMRYLPRQCAVRLYTDHGPVRGFDPRCLRQEGYRFRRH